MADRLTSVRFDQETLSALRVLADLNDTNVAAEVREAVRRYIQEVTVAPDLDQRLAEAERKRRARVDEVLASGKA
jgi:predicted DNA-binding protein